MAAIQQNGSAVTGTYGKGTSTNNNNGTAKNAGVKSTVLENSALGGSNVGVFGSTPHDGDHADKAISAGDFAHNHIKPLTMKVTDEIAGVASSALSTTSSTPGLRRSIHKLEVLRTNKITSGIRANKYNRYTGSWDVSYPQDSTDSLANDTAASPSLDVPGQLTYKLGQPVPVSDNDYKAKTN
jgi:hypothetical protein